MRHRVSGKKLGRNGSHRKALIRNMMRSFFLEFDKKGFITTTRVKAKFIQPHVEKMISLSRTKSVHNIRRAMSVLQDRSVVQTLFDQIGPYYQERPGGYTRVLRLTKPRFGDNSTRAYLGYVREDDVLADGDRRARQQDGQDQGVEPAESDPVADADSAATSEGSQQEPANSVEEDSPQEQDSSETESSSEMEAKEQGEGSEPPTDSGGEEDPDADQGETEGAEEEPTGKKDES